MNVRHGSAPRALVTVVAAAAGVVLLGAGGSTASSSQPERESRQHQVERPQGGERDLTPPIRVCQSHPRADGEGVECSCARDAAGNQQPGRR